MFCKFAACTKNWRLENGCPPICPLPRGPSTGRTVASCLFELAVTSKISPRDRDIDFDLDRDLRCCCSLTSPHSSNWSWDPLDLLLLSLLLWSGSISSSLALSCSNAPTLRLLCPLSSLPLLCSGLLSLILFCPRPSSATDSNLTASEVALFGFPGLPCWPAEDESDPDGSFRGSSFPIAEEEFPARWENFEIFPCLPSTFSRSSFITAFFLVATAGT